MYSFVAILPAWNPETISKRGRQVFKKKKEKEKKKETVHKKTQTKNVHNICWPNSPSSRVHKQEWPMTGKTHTIKKVRSCWYKEVPGLAVDYTWSLKSCFRPPVSHTCVHVFTHATNDADALSLKPCGLCVQNWVTHHLPHQCVRTNASTTRHAYALTPATVVCLVHQQLL